MVLTSHSWSFAADTLKVNLVRADSLFLKNNLILLAQKYNVNAQKALIQQAKLWDNPNVYAEVNLYNPTKKQWFDAGATGEKVFAINQLITIAGKRNNRIKLAKIDAEIAEFEFYDVMRTLKYQLRSSFFEIYYLSKIQLNYDEQIGSLKQIVREFEKQEQKGNLSLKEVMRLKALMYEFENEKLQILYQLADQQKILQTLLQTKQFIAPQVTEEDMLRYTPKDLAPDNLYNQAIENRADIKIQVKELEYNEVNYKLQKSNAVPDLKLGGSYDQNGNYIPNYTAVTLSMDLPVLNRNQGNIKSAKYRIDYQKNILQNTQLNLQNEIYASVNKAIETEKLVQTIDEKFNREFDDLNNAVLINFQKKNISLIEFVDFYHTYLDNVNQVNQLKLQRVNTYEELNFNVGKELFK